MNRLLLVAFTLLTFLYDLTGQSLSQQLTKPSNMGTEWYLTSLPIFNPSAQSALLLYISSVDSGSATIEIPSKGFKQIVELSAHTPTQVSIDAGKAQVFTYDSSGGIRPEQVYANAAIHVKSTVPAVIYGVSRFNNSSDSYVALPIEALSNTYVVSSVEDMSAMFGGYSLPSETAIVAVYDGTKIDFTLGGPSVTQTGGGMRPGQSTTFTLNAGDVWVVGNDVNSKGGDLTGSKIISSQPVAVFSGNQCANVPTNIGPCDFVCEQERSRECWGRHYPVPKYSERVISYMMRVLSSSVNCVVTIDDKPLKTLSAFGGSEWN